MPSTQLKARIPESTQQVHRDEQGVTLHLQDTQAVDVVTVGLCLNVPKSVHIAWRSTAWQCFWRRAVL